jgi:hypothetical protein
VDAFLVGGGRGGRYVDGDDLEPGNVSGLVRVVLGWSGGGGAEAVLPLLPGVGIVLARAREQGVGLVGPGGLVGGLAKTVLTEIGPVEIEVPRDRDGSFDPKIVRKRQRRLDGIDEIVLSLTARGLTTGEVAAHFDEVYGAEVSKDTISKITDKVIAEMTEWQNRPLDRVYPVIFIDAIVVKVRDGQVTNKPFYVAVGVTTAGERDILGIWAGDGGEDAKYWLQVLTEIKNRGVEDVCIAVCDGLKGLPKSITTTWEHTVVQQCVVHLTHPGPRWPSALFFQTRT